MKVRSGPPSRFDRRPRQSTPGPAVGAWGARRLPELHPVPAGGPPGSACHAPSPLPLPRPSVPLSRPWASPPTPPPFRPAPALAQPRPPGLQLW